MKRKDRRAQRLAAYRKYSLRWRRVGDIPYEVDVAWKSERGVRVLAAYRIPEPALSDLAYLLLMELAHKKGLSVTCIKTGWPFRERSKSELMYSARADILWRRAARRAKLSPGEPLTGDYDS